MSISNNRTTEEGIGYYNAKARKHLLTGLTSFALGFATLVGTANYIISSTSNYLESSDPYTVINKAQKRIMDLEETRKIYLKTSRSLSGEGFNLSPSIAANLENRIQSAYVYLNDAKVNAKPEIDRFNEFRDAKDHFFTPSFLGGFFLLGYGGMRIISTMELKDKIKDLKKKDEQKVHA